MSENKRPRKNNNRRNFSKKKKRKYRDFLPMNENQRKILSTKLDDATYIIFDIETTGGNPERNGITEIAALRYVNGEVVDKFYSMVNPGCRIPPIVRKMTGITDKMVKNEPPIDDVMPGFIEFIKDDILVSHNTIGDLKFLVYFAKKACDFRLENFFLCTHLLTEKLIPESKDKSLKGLAKFFEFDLGNVHRAEDDAYLTLALFKEILVRLKKRSQQIVEDGVRLQGDMESGIRLGWGVDETKIEGVPKKCGVFSLYGREKEPLFVSSGLHLSTEIGKLKRYKQLPRPLLRLVLQTYEIKYEVCDNIFDALLKEAEYIKKHKPKFEPGQWHLRTLYTLNLNKTSAGYQLSIGQIETDTLYAFGLVKDRKFLQEILQKTSDVLGLEYDRRGVFVPESYKEIMVDFFSGDLQSSLDRIKKSRFSLSFLLDWKNWGKINEEISLISKLCHIDLPSQFGNLLCECGIVVGRGSRSDEWLIYPVKYSNPSKAISVRGDWRNWLKESRKGQDLISSLKECASAEHKERRVGGEYTKVNSTLWLMFINKGRGGFCSYHSIAEFG